MKLDEAILRIGLIAAGLPLVNGGADLWAQSTLAPSLPAGLALSFAAWGIGSALFVMALVMGPNPRWTWLILIAFLLVELTHAYLNGLNYTPLTVSHTDNEMVAGYAAQTLRQGQNPYQWDYADILRVYRDRGGLLTPWLDGAGQSRLTYPALPTLILWGLEVFGPGQPRVLSFLFQLLLLTLVFVSAPPGLRPVIVLPLFILRPFVTLSLNGTQDVVWSALLVGMILAWRRPTWRAVLFGLACAFRQQPWFAAPFLLIYLWREPGEIGERRRRLAHFIMISAGVFAAINLPFMIWDFRAWAQGVFEPLYAQFNVYSQGLAIVSQLGFVPLPRRFYTLLQASTLALMMFVHWRHPDRVGQAFWLFPGIFFWFYYRGLGNYWFYWLPPLLAAISRYEFGAVSSPRWRRTIDVGALMLAANLFLAAAFVWFAPAIETTLFLPFETIYGDQPLVARLKVAVTNRSASTMWPRFAVQGDSGAQPLPWRIELGPARAGGVGRIRNQRRRNRADISGQQRRAGGGRRRWRGLWLAGDPTYCA